MGQLHLKLRSFARYALLALCSSQFLEELYGQGDSAVPGVMGQISCTVIGLILMADYSFEKFAFTGPLPQTYQCIAKCN